MRVLRTLLALAVLESFLGACTTTAPHREAPSTVRSAEPLPRDSRSPEPPRPARGVPFYDQDGVRYHVLARSDGYREQGVASWYGSDFHGRRTSSGETYDMNSMTAAHRTLPLPTKARVTNLSNGRSIVVRINDRGPFKKDRLIDLSYAAARELGMIGPGTALVDVQALTDSGNSAGNAVATGPPGRLFVQLGAFGDLVNAERLKQRLASQGFSNVVIRYDAGGRPARYRVRLGPIADSQEYDAIVSRVERLDLRGPRLVVESGDPAWNVPAGDEHGAPGG
jgi:rare lipoprotein A